MHCEELEMDFGEADRRYGELKKLRDDGVLGDEEFDVQLKQLMVLDDKGLWWARSRRTGKWHYNDGTGWVRGTPFAELVRVCAKYDGPRFYVDDAIPAQKLTAARSSFPIPADEGVAALVDTSIPWGYVYGLAVCEEGLRWRTRGPLIPKRLYLAWHDFADVPIDVRPPWLGSLYRLELGKGNAFFADDRVMEHDELRRLLVEIQNLVKA
jgi:hypothetical protein